VVRKKRAAKAQRIRKLDAAAEEWLAKIRSRLPEEGTAAVTVHKLPQRKFLVSFRATASGETLISEAREESLEKSIRAAGTRLYERLGEAPPGAAPKGFSDRVREIFWEGV
jgi:hypothetical protein